MLASQANIVDRWPVHQILKHILIYDLITSNWKQKTSA